MTTTAYSIVATPADGGTDTFTVPFPYLARAHVHVFVDGAEVPIGTLMWPTTGTVKIPGGAAVLAGKTVRIQRITPANDTAADFRAGGLDAADLNRGFRQQLYLNQEALDAAGGVPLPEPGPGAGGVTSRFDLGGNRLRNVGDARDPGDAISQKVLAAALANLITAATFDGEIGDAAASAIAGLAQRLGALEAVPAPDLSPFTRKSLNLQDLADKAAARSNLGLGAAAVLAAGLPGGVALYDDVRFGQVGGAGVKTIKDYGAKTDGSDCTAACNAMFAETGDIVIGPGEYVILGAVGSLNETRGVKALGAGIGRTTVRLGANGRFNLSGLGWEFSGFNVMPVAGAIVTKAIHVGRPRYSSESGHIRNNRFRANSASSYIALGCEMTQVWYSRIENNHFHSENYSGVGFKFNYSVNINTIGNYFLFMDTAYHWTMVTYPAEPGEGIANFTCEGHTISGNVFAFNRCHLLLEAGLYPVIQNNVIDLCKPDGVPVLCYAFLCTVVGNWFAVVQGQGNPGAPLRFHDSDSHVLISNTWAGNDRLGTCLTFTNCNFVQVVSNNFRFYKSQLTASGCDAMTVALNIFVGFANVGADLGGVSNLRWIGNTLRGDAGSYGLGAVLPSGVYDPTDTVALNALIQQRAQQAAQDAVNNAGVIVSFHTRRTFTVQSAATAVLFPVDLPAGRFSGSPVFQATLSNNYGSLMDIRVQGNASQAQIIAVRNDGGQFPAGAALDISLSVLQPNG